MKVQFFNNIDEWRLARLGLPTSSEMSRLMPNGERLMTDAELSDRPKTGAGSKSKWIEDENLLSDGAISYIEELVAEILAEPEPDFFNSDMGWGKENEPQAVRDFAEAYGHDLLSPDFRYAGVTDPMFYTMADIAGGSPDLVMLNAIAEVKCPKSVTHLKHMQLTLAKLKEKHFDKYCQMQFNMLLCERPLCYFISYDPRYKRKKLRLFVLEVPQDIELQEKMVNKVKLAREYMDALLIKLNTTIMLAHHDAETDSIIVQQD